ncbi:hypothetical protein [Phyllobacterium myrsinacearum]|uniref:Transcriptional regulator n=1 Tax=Phyllobacterium myrsinacearum TaxID=28101 RepID=A0A839ESL3_9HYPH|nr:hypothetical protein [Phyllobacterium myrsinacearum]MBA8881095.1 hypothetical protein [Phyllobacterium myrsinacearum]
MDHNRFSECLAYLFWSQETLADILECDRFLVRAWAEGGQPIPGSIAAWIETLALLHEVSGIPDDYKGRKLEDNVH